MKIGELARQAGCKVVTVRYYEREGLLDGPERSGANYRVYGPEALDRLLFIRRCRQHGMSLAEIRDILDFCRNPVRNCGWINGLIERHIANVDAQIAELRHLRGHLSGLLRECAGDRGGQCGIVKCLHEENSCEICRKRQSGGTAGKNSSCSGATD